MAKPSIEDWNEMGVIFYLGLFLRPCLNCLYFFERSTMQTSALSDQYATIDEEFRALIRFTEALMSTVACANSGYSSLSMFASS